MTLPLICLLCIFIIIFTIILILCFCNNNTISYENEIANLTNKWCDIAVNGSVDEMVNMFCDNAILIGTVSQTIRDTPTSIKQYFNYFMNIPGLDIMDVEYNIKRINNTTYVNNTYITWVYVGRDPFVARMTFIYERSNGKWCLFLLHSSILPELIPELKIKY